MFTFQTVSHGYFSKNRDDGRSYSPTSTAGYCSSCSSSAKVRSPWPQALCSKLMDMSHFEHAAGYVQNMRDKRTTKKGRSSSKEARNMGSSWHKVGIKDLPLLRTCLEKQSSVSPVLTPSLATSRGTVFIETQASGILRHTLRVHCS